MPELRQRYLAHMRPVLEASFHPARAEQEPQSYRVAVTTATNSPVVINEFMASNTTSLADA